MIHLLSMWTHWTVLQLLYAQRWTCIVVTLSAGDAYVFQQDSAPAHHVRQTVELLQCETLKFVAPDLWPPNSPDLNPVGYRIWDVMQDCVYQMPVRDLQQCLTDTRNGLSHSIVNDAVDEWWKRLGACVKEKGKHMEHLLYNNWTWTRLVVQLNLLCFRLCNNMPTVLSLHVSLCTWLISQGSVAAASGWGEQVNNGYVAHLPSILYSKYYWNRSPFVETTVIWKWWAFLLRHSV